MSGDERSGAGGPQIHCHVCNAELPSDATFCLQCGSRVRAIPPAPSMTTVGAPAAKSNKPVHTPTMLGVSPSATPPLTAVPAPAAVPTPAADLQSTLVDRPSIDVPSAEAATLALPAPQLPTAVPNKQRTMIGVAREGLSLPSPVPTDPPPPAPPSVPPRSVTMMGVAGPSPAPPAPGPFPVASAPPPAEVDPNAHRRRETPPFVGGTSPGSAPRTGDSGYAPQRSFDRNAETLKLAPRRSSAPWVVAGLVGLALLGGGAFLAYHAFGPTAPVPLQAEVRLVEGVMRVHATIPGSDARWRIIYRGQESAIGASGSVDFPLVGISPDDVGDVVLPIEVRDPTGQRSERALRVVIGYRVTADLDHTGDDPPRVHLRFRVPLGASLSIAGQPITLAGQVGVAEIPAPAAMPMEAAAASRSERFPIEVRTTSGVTIRGEYELRVPRLPLRLELPGPLSHVDAAMVTVEGSLPRATRVLVGSQAATLMGDHFRAEVPIAPGANNLTVRGFAPGGAPATASFTVYRSTTPQDYLASGGGDRGVAPLVTPTAASVRLRVRGRVINSTQAAGELPSFQMVVADRACPGQQCLAWVDMAPGSLVRVNETVEVVGETHGTRTYVTQGGQRRTDAVIRALFLTRP